MGFNVAFGLTSYDGSPEFIEDPDYVTVIPTVNQWGFEGVDEATWQVEVGVHRCSPEEFGFDYYEAEADPEIQSTMPKPMFYKPD